MSILQWFRRLSIVFSLLCCDELLPVEEIRALRRLRHDMRNHFFVLSGYAAQGHCQDIEIYLRTLLGESAVKPVRAPATGNPTADTVLCTKLVKARQAEINLTHDLRLSSLSFMRAPDITCAFSNLLDNAIAATMAANTSNADITLTSHESAGILHIICKNPCTKPPCIRNGKLCTSKANAFRHGLGIGQIQRAAARYGGLFRWEYDPNGFFIAELILPLPVSQSA